MINSAVEKVIARAVELSALSKLELRLEHPDAIGESKHAALEPTKGKSRQELIDEILRDEFSTLCAIE